MARHPEITLKDVSAACEQIVRLGHRPTLDGIYAILKKGSRTTMARLLRKHLASQRAEEKTAVACGSPIASQARFLNKIQVTAHPFGRQLFSRLRGGRLPHPNGCQLPCP